MVIPPSFVFCAAMPPRAGAGSKPTDGFGLHGASAIADVIARQRKHL
ncbi:MAG: hypothetical protein AAFW84_36245 [Cyanobacteria bacterium J06635_15]